MTDKNTPQITHETPHEMVTSPRLATILGYVSVTDLDDENAVHLDTVCQDEYDNGDHNDAIEEYENDYYHVSVLNDQGKSIC